jgi:hypothetical protein
MFSDMKPAEKRLLEACQNGEILDLGNERPTEKTTDNEIRGEFLRCLILSNNRKIQIENKNNLLLIDPKGIIFIGVYISGKFDFSYCETTLPFIFSYSNFENEIDFSNSKIRLLNLHGSGVPSINAQSLICTSSVFLRKGFESIGEVNFLSAQIDGILDCSNGKFINEKGKSLNCNRAKIRETVFLNNNFESNGKVDFISAQIGSLNCSNGKFINEIGDALSCDKAKIRGAVFLIDNFKTIGNLNFSSVEINKTLFFSELTILGSCILTSAKIDTIYEKEKFWAKDGFHELRIDGLTYKHLLGDNINTINRKKWLDKMPEFKPQPYKQLAKVLRNMGHNKDASDIMMKYNNIITSKTENWFIKKLKQIYGFTAGYGYKPMRVLGTMFIVWLFCSLFYWNASKVAVFAPINPLVFQKKDSYNCNVNSDGTSLLDIFSWSKYDSNNNWVLNKNLDGEYTTFNPFMYSLDVILPIVDLQVEKDWGQFVPLNNWTLNDFTRWIMWFEILFGWTYSLMLVAILSGLAKNEKD